MPAEGCAGGGLVRRHGCMASKDEPNRNAKYDPKKPHITDSPITRSNWYQHVNWLNVFFILGIPALGCVQAYFTPLKWQTAVWAVIYYLNTGLLSKQQSVFPYNASSSYPSQTAPPASNGLVWFPRSPMTYLHAGMTVLATTVLLCSITGRVSSNA